jgi:predicted dehydrogenase
MTVDAETRGDIHVALAGYGFAGRTFHAPLIRSVAGLRLHRIVSTDSPKVARDWPGIPVVTYDAALTDASVDLVVIATPHAVHAQMARRAIEAGKHVVVEKPMAVSDEEARALCALAARAGTVATVFHSRRWDADFLTLRAMLNERRLGRVVRFESRFDRYRPVVRDRWRERPGPGAGTWFDLGAHLVDQALQLFGEPQSMYAELASERLPSAATDFFHVRLHYENLGVVLESSSLAAEPGPRFRVLGTDGAYTKFGVDPQEDALRSRVRPATADAWGEDSRAGILTRMADGNAVTVEVPNTSGNYMAFYLGVRQAIRRAISAPPVTFEEAARVVHALVLAERSARERRELPWSTED